MQTQCSFTTFLYYFETWKTGLEYWLPLSMKQDLSVCFNYQVWHEGGSLPFSRFKESVRTHSHCILSRQTDVPTPGKHYVNLEYENIIQS